MDPVSFDSDLILKIGRFKDRSAFETLCERYAGKIHGMACRMGLEYRDAEEATQDLLIRIWQTADQWAPDKGASAKTWIYKLAKNLIIDHHRKNKKFLHMISGNTLSENNLSQDSDSKKMTQQDLIQKALSNLPETQKTALILFYYQGLSTREIAHVQNTTEKGVERSLSHARKKMRASILDLEEK
mgnify:FL=1